MLSLSCHVIPLQGGIHRGLAMGCVISVILFGFSLLFFYAAVLVAQGAATGGSALTTMFCVFQGGM